MSALASAYRKEFLKQPPIRTMKRAIEGISDFMKAFKDPDTLYKNNGTEVTSNHFSIHPDIPQNYFDEIKDGVLYVYEGTTDKLIRKDTSILTLSGLFYSNDDPNVYHSYVWTNDKERLEFKKAVLGDVELQKKFNGRIVYSQKLSAYVEVDCSKWRVGIDNSRLNQLLKSEFFQFCATIDVTPSPYEEDMGNPAYFAFIPYLREQVTKDRIFPSPYFTAEPYSERVESTFSFTIPPHSSLFSGIVIYGSTTLSQDISRYPVMQRMFVLNHASPHGILFLGEATRLHTVTMRIDGEMPFVFGIQYQSNTITGVTENKYTRNNDGELMSYSSKVHEYKISFLMSPEEESFFKAKEKEYKDSILKWKKEKDAYIDTHGDTYPIPKPSKHPHDEPIFLGLELELNARYPHRSSGGVKGIIKKIADSKIGDHVLMKSDGSIGMYGIEIVTVPATLAYHKKIFMDHFFGSPNEFHKMLMATDQCGIHVHISKKSFTELDLGKFMTFINKKENTAFIDAVANRPHNTYCVRNALAGKNKFGIDISAKVVQQACKGRLVKNKLSFSRIEDFNRRQAVNLQNAHTVEVRAFKSSNDKNNVLRKLEFCESLVKFVRNHSMQQMTLYDYVNFMLDKANKSAYPHMIKWLASKDFIGHERKKINDPKTGEPINKLCHVYSQNLVVNPHPQVKPNLRKKEV